MDTAIAIRPNYQHYVLPKVKISIRIQLCLILCIHKNRPAEDANDALSDMNLLRSKLSQQYIRVRTHVVQLWL